jgi:outer membrane protein TolC
MGAGFIVFAALLAAAPSAAEELRLGLVEAVRQALDANPDLAAQRRALAADREEVGLSRSVLLPQVSFGAAGQVLDSDRSDDHRGNVSQESASVQATLSQILYDEESWAVFQAQQHIFDQQQEQYESFRLGIIGEAAGSFFELDSSLALERIQEANRELTRQNLETTRARVATGYSSERELLRWLAQLAQNDIDVEQALTSSLSNRFELNRVRSRPREALVAPLPSSVEELGFVYARDTVARALTAPDADRRLRNYLVRVGISRSPVLRGIDAAIAAQGRTLTAKRRAFWVPSLSLVAGIDHLAASGSSASSFQETEYGARAELSFPIFQGGAKSASLRQASEALASLRLERRAETESLDQTIRTAFAQASGAYRSVGYAGEQESAAKKNFELVYEAYVLGVVDYIDLLDAQNQYLTAQISSVNALFDFLEQLLDAEEQIALFPFLEEPSDVESLLKGLERELGQP